MATFKIGSVGCGGEENSGRKSLKLQRKILSRAAGSTIPGVSSRRGGAGRAERALEKYAVLSSTTPGDKKDELGSVPGEAPSRKTSNLDGEVDARIASIERSIEMRV
jgi:hypothetical protein